jgi:hypothetical protein
VNTVQKYLSSIGRKGGSAKSTAKSKAGAENLKKARAKKRLAKTKRRGVA